MKTKDNMIGLWPNLYRVLEICIVNNNKLCIYANNDYKQANDDFEEIANYLLLKVDNNAPAINPYSILTSSFKDADVILDLRKPTDYLNTANYYTFSDMKDRVIKARDFNVKNTELNNDGLQLLKLGVSKLNFSFKDIRIIKELAISIAKLDESDNILTEHVAEALMYRNIADFDINTHSILTI